MFEPKSGGTFFWSQAARFAVLYAILGVPVFGFAFLSHAATFRFEHAFRLRILQPLPADLAASCAEACPVIVVVDSSGDLYLSGARVDPDSLRARVRTEMLLRPLDLRYVVLKASPELRYNDIARAVDALYAPDEWEVFLQTGHLGAGS